MGPVEQAVRAKFKGGDTLYTVSNREPFTIGVIDTDGIVLMLGRKQSSAPLSWECLESVPAFLRNTPGWVPAGGNHSVAGEPGTLDQHLKGLSEQRRGAMACSSTDRRWYRRAVSRPTAEPSAATVQATNREFGAGSRSRRQTGRSLTTKNSARS